MLQFGELLLVHSDLITLHIKIHSSQNDYEHNSASYQHLYQCKSRPENLGAGSIFMR